MVRVFVVSTNLIKVIAEAIKAMSARELGELLAEVSGEFGVSISIPSASFSPAEIDPAWIVVPKRMTETMVGVAGQFQWGPYSMDREVRKMWDAVLAESPPYPVEAS